MSFTTVNSYFEFLQMNADGFVDWSAPENKKRKVFRIRIRNISGGVIATVYKIEDSGATPPTTLTPGIPVAVLYDPMSEIEFCNLHPDDPPRGDSFRIRMLPGESICIITDCYE